MKPKELPENVPVNWFSVLSSIDCSGHTEEKNGFTYLEWPFAIATMTKYDPAFQWGLDWFTPAFTIGNQAFCFPETKLPYVTSSAGVFVSVWATFHGKKITHLYPVLDYKNKPITQEEVNAFDINTSQMRGVVKVCALHGLGMYIFEGKGGNRVQSEDDEAMGVANRVRGFLELDLEEEPMALRAVELAEEIDKDHELFLRAWAFLAASERSAFKKWREAGLALIKEQTTGEEKK